MSQIGNINVSLYDYKKVQTRCCSSVRTFLVMSRRVPLCCKRRLVGSKERLLMEAYQKIGKNMRIDKLIRTLLTNKGILKNELNSTKDIWSDAQRKYGKIFSSQYMKSEA